MENFNSLKFNDTVVAVLTTTCNKYKPGKHSFYLQSMNATNSQSRITSTERNSTSNLMNKDTNIGLTQTEVGSNIELYVPKEVARWFETKWIPPGTRFLVGFDGGDITKPKIVGRDYVCEQGKYNDEDEEE